MVSEGRYFSTRPTGLQTAPSLYAELKALAGPTYVFEAFSDQLRGDLQRAGRIGSMPRPSKTTPGTVETMDTG